MTTVRLIDGREVDSYSAEWRAECEARHVLNMETNGQRYAYLARVESKRGKPARDALQKLVMDVWRARGDERD